MRQSDDKILAKVTQQIVNQIKSKATESNTKNPEDIIDTSGNFHFDWYFPNLASNPNVEKVASYGIQAGDNGIIYDEDLVKSLINDKEYRENYLTLTKKYFTSAGLLKADGSAGDATTVKYDQIRNYLVRLNKIVQSYRILMEHSQYRRDSPEALSLKDFNDELQKIYTNVYDAFKSDEANFSQVRAEGPDGYGLSSIAQCFERDIDKMIFNQDTATNKTLVAQTKQRPIADRVFKEASAHVIIENEIDARRLLGDSPLAPPPPQPLAPPSTEKLKDRAKGAIYGQAIFDALGLTTEFLGRKQAKILMRDSKVLSLDADFKVSTSAENLEVFKKDPYAIRKIGNYFSEEIKRRKNTSGTYGDDRSENNNPWRQYVPKGSFTDDTDQAVLKFKALEESEGDLKKAQTIYAKDIGDWRKGGLKEYFGKGSFGLGGNTKEVIECPDFTKDPEQASKSIWEKNAKEQGFFPQANGALMSSSYILQYYPNDLEKAQKATIELAKVTHYDPLVSAHCVAYITMLYHLQHHKGEVIDDEKYKEFLDKSFEAGKKVFDERKEEYNQFKTLDSWKEGRLDAKIVEWEEQMQEAIYSNFKTIDGRKKQLESWEELDLVDPTIDGGKTVQGDFKYDNIGMSHRALSAGFYGLKQLRQKIQNGQKSKEDAFAEVCVELMAQGGDADTNGTIVGSLCGSYVGFNGIDKKMIDGLGAGDSGNKIGKVVNTTGGLFEIQEQKLLEHIVEISHVKIDEAVDEVKQAKVEQAEVEKAKVKQAPNEPINSIPSLNSENQEESAKIMTKSIIAGALIGAGAGLCVSALTVGLVFSAPVVITVVAGVACGAGVGYAVGTFVTKAKGENVVGANQNMGHN